MRVASLVYCIGRRIYLNLSKSTQSAAWRYFMCKSWHCYFHLLYISILLPAKFYPPVCKVHAGSFRVSIIHRRTLTDMDYSICNVRTVIILIMRAHTHRGWAHRQRVITTFLIRKNSQIFLVLLTGFEPRSFRDLSGVRLLYQLLSHSNYWATPSPLSPEIIITICWT